MTLTYISCSSDFYTFYVNVSLSLGCMIRKVSAEDIAIRGNGTSLEYRCPTRHFVFFFFFFFFFFFLPASVAQLDTPSDWRPGGRRFNPRRGLQHSFVEIDHEIFSKVILSLPLIQEGQLSVSGERMCTILVNHLED